jgi:hypothetical protein
MQRSFPSVPPCESIYTCLRCAPYVRALSCWRRPATGTAGWHAPPRACARRRCTYVVRTRSVPTASRWRGSWTHGRLRARQATRSCQACADAQIRTGHGHGPCELPFASVPTNHGAGPSLSRECLESEMLNGVEDPLVRIVSPDHERLSLGSVCVRPSSSRFPPREPRVAPAAEAISNFED